MRPVISLGQTPNDGTGDNLRTALGKVNQSFDVIFSALADLAEEQLAIVHDPINIGALANDGTGDTIAIAVSKLNRNFGVLFSLVSSAELVEIRLTDTLRGMFGKINDNFVVLFTAFADVISIAPSNVVTVAPVVAPTPVTAPAQLSYPSENSLLADWLTLSVNDQEVIDVGSLPNDGTGDPLRIAFQKVNNNFSNLFSTTTFTTESYTTGATPDQVIWEVPVISFTQGMFQVKSQNTLTNDSQDINISAQITNDLADVKFTGYGTTFSGSPVCTYNMDIDSANVRLLITPLSSLSLFHFISSQVTQTDLP